jgi:hypothetical protein
MIYISRMNVKIYINPGFFGSNVSIAGVKKGRMQKASRPFAKAQKDFEKEIYRSRLDEVLLSMDNISEYRKLKFPTSSKAKQSDWNNTALEIKDNLEKLNSAYFPENLSKMLEEKKLSPSLADAVEYSISSNLDWGDKFPVAQHREGRQENERIMKESVCRGVIDNSYLNEKQIDNNALIFVVRGESGKREENKSGEEIGEKVPGKVQAFAVCRFKSYKSVNVGGQAEKQHYLYIDVICSKSKKATPILWKSIEDVVKVNHKKNSIPPTYLSGIQLSSLTYVIGYYYYKKGFRFYKIDTAEKNAVEDAPCNKMAATFAQLKGPRLAFLGKFNRADDRNYEFLYETQKFEDIPKYNNIIGTNEQKQKQLEDGEEDDEKGLWYYDWAQGEKVKVRNKTKTQSRRGTAELLIDFISNEAAGGICGEHSVQFGIENTPLQTGRNAWKDRDKKILKKDWIKKKDPGSEGWTMFWQPETYDYDLNIKRGEIANILKTSKKEGGKRTKKRALKKRHRKKTKRRVKRKNKRTRRKNRKKTKKRY